MYERPFSLICREYTKGESDCPFQFNYTYRKPLNKPHEDSKGLFVPKQQNQSIFALTTN